MKGISIGIYVYGVWIPPTPEYCGMWLANAGFSQDKNKLKTIANKWAFHHAVVKRVYIPAPKEAK